MLYDAKLVIWYYTIDSPNDDVHVTDRRVDFVGVISFMLGIIAVVYYLSESTTAGWGSAHTLALFLAGIALLVFFIFWERRIDYPIMPFRIWGSVRFRTSVIVIVCVTATYNTMIFFTSLTFQNVLKYSPLITACCYIVHGVGLVVGLYTIGWIFIIVSSIIFAQIVPGTSYWHFAFPALIITCLGLSPTWMCCQVNAVADAPDEDQGVVGAVFNVTIQLGGPIGPAISTILSQAYEPAAGAEGAALMSGYRAAFYTLFCGVAPEKEDGNAQEKGLEVVDESQISGAEGKAELEDDDEDENKEGKKGGSNVSVAHTVIV
ncbi:major facilitator superfamily domain-containing protein [Linnemannia elongata]|nr:major facilitator superfamily domain-containing protein [Linnemannia elongata]